MWYVDTDQYYSSPDRKYFTYENPADATDKEDLKVLKAALGIAIATNRTLILPTYFHESRHNYGPLNGLLLIRDFQQQFSGLYSD